ncbi:MAG: arginyl-tRNA synthetase [Halieaceae bacterium]|jgi:arginyl-tRNA synthetase
MKEHVSELLEMALNALKEEGVLPTALERPIQVDRTRDSSHGELATNLALSMAKAAGLQPRDLAMKICNALPSSPHVSKTEIAGPGFINFFLTDTSAQSVILDVLSQGAEFGHNNVGAGQQIQVEFVSANPTGPLHVGHGRGAAIGDSLCRLLKATGYEVGSEFYYNDAGAQINNLALSVQARCRSLTPESPEWPEDGYRGAYITDVANAYLAGDRVDAADKHVTAAADPDNLLSIRDFAVAYLRREQDMDLRAFGVTFDVYFLESSLYENGDVDATIERLIESGLTYEHDGATWLQTTRFGDDKDRVMRKSDGGFTYFLPDVAYHANKWSRGFKRVVNEQGADHHSTVTRVRAGLQALDMGIPEGWPEYVLHQMVLVMRGGEEVKLSKRAGSYVTLRDLIDEVGCDATRYFLCARAASSQLTFDIDLALSQTNDNPVFYIQYAHARVCSVLGKLAEHNWAWSTDSGTNTLELLTEPAEKTLLKRLSGYPDVVASAARALEPHVVANYLRELAGEYHSYYNANRILADDSDLRNSRVALSVATKQVIANGLALLGVSAPQNM